MISIRDVAEIIGMDAVDNLMKFFPGERLYIPKKQSTKKFETAEDYNAYIFQLCSSHNMDLNAVSEITGLSPDRIRHIAADEIRNRKKK